MTTIFADADAGIMVCDSKTTIGGEWMESTKVVRVGDELIGFSGTATEATRWLAWYAGGQHGTRPKIENSNALILSARGLHILDATGGLVLVERGFMATGSGGQAATGAFIAGADAETAVYIACQVDTYSGGAVIVHRLAA